MASQALAGFAGSCRSCSGDHDGRHRCVRSFGGKKKIGAARLAIYGAGQSHATRGLDLLESPTALDDSVAPGRASANSIRRSCVCAVQDEAQRFSHPRIFSEAGRSHRGPDESYRR